MSGIAFYKGSTQVADINGQLATSKGGTGQDLSASTGILKVAAGVVSAGTVDVASVVGLNATSPEAYGAVGDGSTDDTTAIAAAIATGKNVFFSRSYKITAALLPVSNQTIVLASGCTIRQYTASTEIFKCVSLDRFTLRADGAMLYGEGTWSAGWTGNSGHLDRGIRLLGCTRALILGPSIKNCGHAGIEVSGGDGIRIVAPHIEGTHAYSTAISASGNFQMGIYVTDDVTYGVTDNLIVTGADISGVAQGLVVESAIDAGDRSIICNDWIVHDIPGQHAAYIQGSGVHCNGWRISNVYLSGIKIQSDATSNEIIKNISAVGLTVRTCGSNMFELGVLGSGSIADVILSATGQSIVTGLNTSGAVKQLRCTMQLETVSARAVTIQGAGPEDIDVTVTARDVQMDGVLVNATSATGIRIRPVLRNCNLAASTYSGILVNSASANVELFDPIVTSDSTAVLYGIYNQTAGSVVKIRGSLALDTNFTTQSVGGTIAEWPWSVGLSEPEDHGLLAWNYRPEDTVGGSALTPAGTLWVQKIKVKRAMLVTNLVAYLSSVGVTLTTGQCFGALFDSAKALLGQTTDCKAAWESASPLTKVMPLATPVKIAAGDYYIAFWYQGTTGPGFQRIATSAGNANLAAANSRWATADTGKTTTAPNPLGAFTANALSYWVGLS